MEADLLAAAALGVAAAWESGQKRISLAAATEDIGRGDDHDPNDGGCPMGVEGVGIW